MNDPYTIRGAQTADLDRLVELLTALQDHIESSNPDLWRMDTTARHNIKGQLASRIAAQKGFVLVAEHNQDGVIGTVFGRIVTNNRYLPHTAGLIDQLTVHTEHRRAGVASRLVSELCRHFAAQDIDDISLRYVVGNQEATEFWTALGFAPRIVTAGAHRQTIKARLAQRDTID